MTPFAPTVSVGERNAWYDRRRKTLERLRVAGLEHGREALREIALDIDEGADVVMVKPALAHLDVIASAAARAALTMSDGNRSEASRQLGISRKRLRRLLGEEQQSA